MHLLLLLSNSMVPEVREIRRQETQEAVCFIIPKEIFLFKSKPEIIVIIFDGGTAI